MGVHRESKADFLVIGGGAAGLRAAIDLAAAGSVLVLSKADPSQSSAHYAHSAIPIALGEDEDITLRLRETLRAGDGLCCEQAARILAEEGPREIRRLTEWGARLEPRALAHPAQYRRTYVPGSRSGEILRALASKAKSLKSIRIELPATAVELLMEGGRVCGATYLDEATGKLMSVRAPAVLLATGGLGQVYAETTNPPEACGDGIALAFRAGALLSDMEFVQFHPTVLYTPKGPRRLLPESLRERGAHLRNLELDRFMLRYHEAGDLAPADVISRAILTEIQRGRGEFVYLDFTSLSEEEIKRSFPHTYADCLESNIDISSDLVPVRPAAHFAIGGIATDLDGAATLAGLYAAGETAANGVHGANRLASNGLLEGLVYGARAAAAMKAGRDPAPSPKIAQGPPGVSVQPETEDGPSTSSAQLQAIAAEIRRLMWNGAAIIRDGAKLYEVAKRLSAIRLRPAPGPNRLYYETENLLEVARVIVSCAFERKESRGAHYRADFPLRDDSEPARHSFLARDSNVFFGPYDSPPAASVHKLTAAS